MSDATSVPATKRRMPKWVLPTVAGAFGLLYAYAVWDALASLIAQASGPVGLNGMGWFVLLMAVAFPILVFALAFRLGSRRRWWELALVMLAGLALTAVFWLNIVGYAAVYGAQLPGG